MRMGMLKRGRMRKWNDEGRGEKRRKLLGKEEKNQRGEDEDRKE